MRRSDADQRSQLQGKADLPTPWRTVSTGAAAVAVIGGFLFGYSICALDSCGELIPVVFQWCNSDWRSDCLASRVCQGLVNAAVYLGAAAGSVLAGVPRLTARGSRYEIIVSDIFFAVGALACAFAKGLVALIVGRLVWGLGLGISAIAAPLYIAEVSPRKIRGRNTAMHGVFIAVGIVVSICIGIPQPPPPSGPRDILRGLDLWYWRVILGLPAVPALAQAILFVFVVPIDPPSFLVLKGRISEARHLLYRSHGQVPRVLASSPGIHKVAELEQQLEELREAAANFRATPRIFIHQAICDPFLRCALLLGFALAAFQQLSGINALLSYSNSLFDEAGIPPEHATLASTLMALSHVFASYFSMKVVDHWGRRKLLMGGPLIQACCLSVITWGGSWGIQGRAFAVTTFISFSMYTMAFSASLGSVTWLYLSEIYPMEIRGSALSFCGVLNWFSCFVVVFGTRFLSLKQACKFFATVCFIGFVGVYLWVVETKGYNMDDSPLTPRSMRSSSSLMGSASDDTLANDKEEEEEDH